MYNYRVTIDAEFTVQASSEEVVRKRMNKLVHDTGFEERNFEWGIERLKPQKGEECKDIGL